MSSKKAMKQSQKMAFQRYKTNIKKNRFNLRNYKFSSKKNKKLS